VKCSMRYRADTRLSAHTAMLLALGAVLGYVETLIAIPMPVPGAKLGLANIAVVIALAITDPFRAMIVSLGRVALVGLATGTLGGPTVALSLAGACAALVAMMFLRSRGSTFSVVGWAVAGAAAHSVAQIAAACLLVGSFAPLALAPLVLALSLPSGLAIGYSARLLISRIPQFTLSVAGR